MNGFLIDPVKQSIEVIALPSGGYLLLKESIARHIECSNFLFQEEFDNMDVIAVDSMGHRAPKNWPFKITEKGMVFGRALILGTNRLAGVLISPGTSIEGLQRMVEFFPFNKCREVKRKLEGSPSLVRPIGFVPSFQ